MTQNALVTLVAMVAMLAALFLLRFKHVVRLIIHSIRSHERGNRWRATRQVVRILVTPRTGRAVPRTPDEAAFLLPDEAKRTVPFHEWQRVDTLVVNAVNVTSIAARTTAIALDVDGSVTIVHHRDGTTYDITVLGPDGLTRLITGPEGVESAVPPRPSIDKGTVAWWAITMDGKAASLWVAEPLAAPRVLHTESCPYGQSYPFTPDGWVVVAGDRVAWTLETRRPGEPGIIAVTTMDGTTHRVGVPRTPTLHRDRAAELQGRRVVAVNMDGGVGADMGRVAAIDLDGRLPTVHILRSGSHPGASVCNGVVVGFWGRKGVLQLPHGVHVRMPAGTSAIDVVSDGEWCAGLVFDPPDGVTRHVFVNELFHLPTGTRQRLSESSAGLVDIRGGRVLWEWAPAGHSGFGTSSWVGQLRVPTLAVEPLPTQNTSLA